MACSHGTLHLPDGDGPWPGVLVFPDAGGVRETFRQMGDRLAGMGYVALIPDIYYRAGQWVPFDVATLFTDEQERARLFRLTGALTNERIIADAGAYSGFLLARPEVTGSAIGTTGFHHGRLLPGPRRGRSSGRRVQPGRMRNRGIGSGLGPVMPRSSRCCSTQGRGFEECTRLDAEDFAITARIGEVRLHGKGDEVRSVPLSGRARELAPAWLDVRDRHPGPVWDGQRGPLTVSGITQVVLAA